ncbi:MAG: hypothetical protein ACYC3I_23960 [Gemmataceae bacterium]
MTLFGKLLVIFNLAFAVLLAAFSYSIYVNGVDWTDSKSKGPPPVPTGQFAIRAVKIDELWKGLPPAQADWARERARLLREETSLADDRGWYDKEIRYVLAGPAKNKPLSEVAFAAKDDANTGVRKGQVLLDDRGHPQMVPVRDSAGAPLQLQSLAEYNVQDVGILNSLAQIMAAHAMQIAQSNEYTDKIIGDKAKGIRGLQERIYDEQAKNAAMLAELSQVEPLVINTMVEAQLINKRHDQMVKRIEELKKIKVASK